MIVVPDTGSIQLPGASAERGTKHKGGEGSEGLRGLKSLGVRDLKHRMAFLACNVICSSMKLGEQAPDSSEEASQLMDFVTDLTVKDKRLLVQMSSGVENNVLQTKRINFNVAISHFASGKFEL